MEFADWQFGLHIAQWLVVISAIAVVSARVTRDRMVAIGLMCQGIAMAFVASESYFRRSELGGGAIAILVTWSLWVLWMSLPAEPFEERPEPARSSDAIAATPGSDSRERAT